MFQILLLKSIFLFGIFFFGLFISYYHWVDYYPSFIYNPYNNVLNEYDYIIVGAGSAGSVVALRLAENKSTSILLLEAGPTGGSVLDIPAALPILQQSSLDWGYKTVPQTHAFKAMTNNVVNWPRGKLIGGTGRFNNMIYVRGHPYDFQEWYKNKTDYNYEWDILQYFKKSENHLGSYKSDNKYHATKGPLFVDDIPYVTELSGALLDAAKFLGFPIQDINGKFSTGFMKPQANLKNGARYSTGHHLLDHKPKNLQIVSNAHVHKVLFRANFEAYAVSVMRFGSKKYIKAKKGVILSAGTVDTAKLLLLSGIGDKKHLNKIGVKQIADLPVGQNLQDHITTGLDLITLPKPLSLNPFSLLSMNSFFSYINKGSGPWTSIQAEALAILHTNCLNATNFNKCSFNQIESPNLQIMALPLGMLADFGANLYKIIGIKQEIWNNFYAKLIGNTTISILPVLLHPKSRGFITLSDKNPNSKPIINPNYLTHLDDVKILIQGIEFIKKLLDTPSMEKLGAKIYEVKIPGCEEYVFDTWDYWECYTRYVTATVYHPVGTARMGHPDDPASVVDYDFKVLNLNKLFVADASVFPNLPSANTNAATVLVAEKAASSIKYYEYSNSAKSYITEVFLKRNFC